MICLYLLKLTSELQEIETACVAQIRIAVRAENLFSISELTTTVRQ